MAEEKEQQTKIGAGALKAMGRAGFKEVAQVLPAFPDSVRPVEERGLFGNLTPQEIVQGKKITNRFSTVTPPAGLSTGASRTGEWSGESWRHARAWAFFGRFLEGTLMNIPVVGLLSAVASALGLYGLFWYHSLSKEEKQEADRLATKYAWDLYTKGLDQLTSQQMSRVHELVKGHFAA